MKLRRFALVTIALASSVAFAGPKAPRSSTPFVPEIGYTYTSGRNTSEVRLSNREGTAAVLVVRSQSGGSVGIGDLAPPNVDGKNRIAFEEKDGSGNRFLKITTWHYDADGSVKMGTPTTLLQFGTSSYPHLVDVEFSPDGKKIAYMIATSQYAREIHVHVFASAATSGSTELLTKMDSNGGIDLAWHASGNHLYYDATIDEKGRKRVFRVPTNQGFQESGQLIIERPEIFIRQLEVTRPNSTYYPDGLLVNYSEDGLVKVAYYADDGVTLGRPQILEAKDGSPLPASMPHMNCAGSETIHTMTNTRNHDEGMYNTVTKDVTTWSTDKSIGRTDWMPCELPST